MCAAGGAWGWGGAPRPGSGAGAAAEGDDARRRQRCLFLRRQSSLGNRKIGFSGGGCDFAVRVSCDPFARARADAGVGFGVHPAAGRHVPRGTATRNWVKFSASPEASFLSSPHPLLRSPPSARFSGEPVRWDEPPAFLGLSRGSGVEGPEHQPRARRPLLPLNADPPNRSARQKSPSPFYT